MNKNIISLILIVFIAAGCAPGASQIAQTTATAAQAETIEAYTPTPLPSPTPVPTPLPSVHIAEADGSIFIGDYNSALSSYEAALNTATDSETQAAALAGVGRAQFLRGKDAEAVQALLTVTENYPESAGLPTTWFFLAQAYESLGSYAEAADAYANSHLSQPGVLDMEQYEWQGDALSQAGSHAAAIDAYQAAIDSSTLTDISWLQIKIADAYFAMGDAINALRIYISVYDATNNDYTRAQMNFLAGMAYTELGLPEQAHARYQDSLNNYPRSFDTYSGLVELVNAGIPVDEYQAGRVYYYARKYGLAFDAFTRFMIDNPDHDGSALHYAALCLREMGRTEEAVAEWDKLINKYQGSPFWADAWDETAYTEWIYFNRPKQAADTYLDYVTRYPSAGESPGFLYEAGRILEYEGLLEESAAIWVRLIDDYPSNELSYRALFKAGIVNYRLKHYDTAQIIFQRAMVLAVSNADQAAANLWIGKTQQVLGDQSAATSSWEQAAQIDPTGYYSERARQLINGEEPFTPSPSLNLEIDWENEQRLGELWLRNTFAVPAETNLTDLDTLAANPALIRGQALWDLGLYSQAIQEFESLRLSLQQDAVNSFRLLKYLLEIGAYRPAIFTSRQILDLAGMDDAATFTAPDYFNHIRFGSYFEDLILEAAEEEDLDPLYLLAAIRQESMFDVGVTSSAGARGLMQIMPATGEELATDLNWPPYYSVDDLFRPWVSIRLGAHYLGRNQYYFDGDLMATLAGYNGGPGNAQTWRDLASGDPDLFLEVIRFGETSLYVTQIADFYNIYKRLYAVE
jgi:peptidoglycan lytic transglycosylase